MILLALFCLLTCTAAAPGWTDWNSKGYTAPAAARSSPFDSPAPRNTWNGFTLGGNRTIHKASNYRAGVNSFPEPNLLDIDIVSETRKTVDNAKTILEGLRDDEISAPLIAESLNTSQCLESIDDAIVAMESSAKLLEDNRLELIYLVATFQDLERENDIIKQTRSSAFLIRVLGDLVPRLTASPVNVKCNGSPQQRIAALYELAIMLENIAGNVDAYLPRQAINYSAKQTAKLAKFLTKLDISLGKLQDGQLCARSDFQSAIYSTIEEIMTDLADYIGDVAKLETRSAAILGKSIQFSELANAYIGIELEQPCGSFNSYSDLADILDDLATIIEDAGVEVLSKELGINFSGTHLDFSGSQISFDAVLDV